MSTSEEHAAENLKNALEFGRRCLVCDRIKCEGLEGGCTCCARCGNPDESCSCCPHCWEDLSTCKCFSRIADNWDKFHYCSWCQNDKAHQVGEQCPSCCAYCKMYICECCQKCRTTPCICCTGCGDLRIKCKCWGAKILSHFMRRAVLYHQNQQELRQFNFPANTAALIAVNNTNL